MVQLPELKGLDLASALQQFDRGVEQGRQRQARNSLAEFGPAALQGDQNAINSLFQNNPNAAIQFSQLAQQRKASSDALAFQRSEADRNQKNVDRAFKFEQSKFTKNHKLKVGELNTKLLEALNKGAPKLSDIAGMRKEFTNLSKDFIKIRNAWSRISEIDPNTATGSDDIAMVFSFMKMLDPTSVVNPGEQASVNNAGGVPSAVRGLWNKLVGGGTLDARARSQILETSRNIFQRQEIQQDKLFETFERLAERNNIDVNDVAIDIGLVEAPEQPGTQPAPARRRFNPQTGTLDPVE